MAVRVAVHQPSPDRTPALCRDSATDVSCMNSTQDHCVDAEHQATDLAVRSGDVLAGGGGRLSHGAPSADPTGCAAAGSGNVQQ
jgi:hypothetical protein